MMVVRATAVIVQKPCQRFYRVLTGTSNGEPIAREGFRLVATNAIGFIGPIGRGNLRRIKAVSFLRLFLRSRAGANE